MSVEPTKEELLDDYRARQVATVLNIRGEVLPRDDDLPETDDGGFVVDIDGCNIDARRLHVLQLDYSPVQIEIRHGIPRETVSALLRKTADWIEQEGDRLMELEVGQLARRVPPASVWCNELDDRDDGFEEEAEQ